MKKELFDVMPLGNSHLNHRKLDIRPSAVIIIPFVLYWIAIGLAKLMEFF